MEGERFAMNFFMECVPTNQIIFFKTVEDFYQFLPSSFLFRLNIVGILLNIVDTVNFLDALKYNDA